MDLEHENRLLTTTGATDPPFGSQIDNHADDDRVSSSPPLSPDVKWYKLEWLWECLCWILVIGALGALVGIIADAQGQPMAAWRLQHSNISINAVVAILSALLKGSCLYIVAEVVGQAK
ncbi:hypothetical protein K402DRAFT_420996 [Aulographum hederae CBS 113979]|uniref:Uncharacterized protein n=1 Tax=Aulographum hederae CBS 113979 TaxID=1176131 RepID=A0A6G1H006_9PEZI|nr:hypothetical protein K402DRAFT_420996 [Aulographum hederae CBS 113979]